MKLNTWDQKPRSIAICKQSNNKWLVQLKVSRKTFIVENEKLSVAFSDIRRQIEIWYQRSRRRIDILEANFDDIICESATHFTKELQRERNMGI